MCILVPSRNNFILILIVGIPNEPLGIIISDTQETLHTMCHISINWPTYTSSQSRCSYTVLLTEAVK
ncbi:Putative respiratory burst oxidase H -like protein [Gossypium arboreum]|uniref:Putative respiratory burst oxidase H-like protein n=1 Tax=Gossypium arboreum TaxID=29729 RepID=A0A0B0NI75_GOSAR|nr:Putative respiratory burst oxidase H -like protein [Gossypium arboreum]